MKAVRDEDIDFSDIPEASASFWSDAKVSFPEGPKTPVNMRLDTDMLEWFRAQGRGY
ncbi:BrnA antitoxin family protein [Caulobacter segnis]